MSSLRKLHQKSYKERSQPSWHSRGFLQKKKDYVVRAADYHRKQDRIRKLKEQAYFRNRDEFRGQMIEQKV
jgi:U3 small nucleolar RNA-associated protein 11